MKIQAIDTNSKKPLANQKFQLQVRGKDSGFLTLTTDASGYFTLDDKYKNQQIAFTDGGTPGQWINATDGGKLNVTLKQGATQGAGKHTTVEK